MLRDMPDLAARAVTTLLGVAAVCGILAICFHIPDIRNTTVTFSLILAILWIATHWGRVESVSASFVASLGFATYFHKPIGLLRITDQEGWVSVAGFLITTIVVSQLSLQARKRTEEALRQKREAECLYELGQTLVGVDRFETIAYTAINQLIPIFGAKSAVFYFRSTDEIHTAGAESSAMDRVLLRRCAESHVTHVDSDALLAIIPLQLGSNPFGSLGITGIRPSEVVLKSIGQLLTVVLQRVEYSEDLTRQHNEIVKQKQISESLLLNILPRDVADELRSNGMVSPKYFEDVTIMFTDFVGFTASAEKLSAETLVRVLNDYFTAFDRICARYNLEKLKTAGDSYMCLSGVPSPSPGHPVDAVLAALEMVQEVINRDEPESPVRWKMRVGIHTGPVIAGVVGINKFAFDIWGDTVNFSSRMESSGEPNRINISERTYSRVRDFFECEHRGKIRTKEKREYDMYFVNGIAPRLLKDKERLPYSLFSNQYKHYFQRELPSFPAFMVDPPAPLGDRMDGDQRSVSASAPTLIETTCAAIQ